MADEGVAGLADGEAVVVAAELARTLDGVRRTARGIAGDLGTGLASAVVYGERLDAVLARAAERLTARLLDRALAPLEGIIAGSLSGLAGAAAGTVAPIAAAGGGGGADGRGGGLTGTAGRVEAARGDGSAGGVADPAGPIGAGRGGGSAGGVADIAGGAGVGRGGGSTGGVAGFAGGAGAAGGTGERAVQVILNITTPDVDGFRRSEAQVSAMLARAVGRGRRGM
jgi:hypothetical protein